MRSRFILNKKKQPQKNKNKYINTIYRKMTVVMYANDQVVINYNDSRIPCLMLVVWMTKMFYVNLNLTKKMELFQICALAQQLTICANHQICS